MIHQKEIADSARPGLSWLKKQKPVAVKDLSRMIQTLSLWNEPAVELIEVLLSKRKGAFWETDTPLLDTARACSALAGCGMIQPDALEWILGQQKFNNWNNNEIDTAYALIALGDSGVKNERGCEWLFGGYGEKWEHAGTTALIITALLKQDRDRYAGFIKNRSDWLISKRESGGWIYIATSNLAIQALILAGERDIEKEVGLSIEWLLEKQNKDNWGNIIATSLSLISIKMYLDKLNSDSV
ncbi:MAG: hypothetical protein Q7U60_03875 [Candidatus Methanoperedens sp.]|nr:hypothetical protein [Candidatus Methanoperedens sp.]